MSRIFQRQLFKVGISSLNRTSKFSAQITSFALKNSLVRKNNTKVAESPEEPKKIESVYVPVDRWEGSWHWLAERGLSVALIPMLGISGFYGGHPTNDFLLGFIVPLHTHIGLSCVVTDYLPHRRLPIINRIVTATQFVLTVGTMYGCYVINTEDIGLTEFVKKIWTA